jgi:hypothetical protein
MSDFGMFLFMTIILVLFVGEPDLHDAIIQYLMKD